MSNLLLTVNWGNVIVGIILIATAIYGTYLGAEFLSKYFRDDE
jgi:hypothetical protein